MSKWIEEFGFEKCGHTNNARFYCLKILSWGLFEGQFANTPFKACQPHRCNIWLMLAKYLNGGYITYQLLMLDGQGREIKSGALNQENMQKRLADLLKRLNMNGI